MKETLQLFREKLRPIYGDRETEAIIRIMFHFLKGWSLTDILIHKEDELSPFIREEADKILNRLLNHEPIQYITGESRFHGMDFKVAPGVLIPRIETEELVDIIIEKYKEYEDLKVLDIGTGSGCIAITLARNLKFAKVTALDISDKALEIAKENAMQLKAKIDFVHADIFKWQPMEKWNIIVSNPPYIEEFEKKDMKENVLLFELHEALFVKEDKPLAYYERIADVAISSLYDKGSLFLEINPLHAKEVEQILKIKGFSEVEILLDSSGKKRFAAAIIN